MQIQRSLRCILNIWRTRPHRHKPIIPNGMDKTVPNLMLSNLNQVILLPEPKEVLALTTSTRLCVLMGTLWRATCIRVVFLHGRHRLFIHVQWMLLLHTKPPEIRGGLEPCCPHRHAGWGGMWDPRDWRAWRVSVTDRWRMASRLIPENSTHPALEWK